MIVYQTTNGKYIGETEAQESPLEPGKFLIPAGAVETTPPAFDSQNQYAEWTGSEWQIKDIPPDYTKEDYWYKDTGGKVSFAVGDMPDSTMTDIEPNDTASVWDETGGQWYIPFYKKQVDKINTIKSFYKAYAKEPVTVNTVTYNGGDSSASAIKGAIDLAQLNGEFDVTLWDIDNVLHKNISFMDALTIVQTIATQYRNRMFERCMKLAEANAATTQAELDAITLPGG